MDAIILAGGLAKRMKPQVEDIPKCLVEINGKTILDYQLEWLKKYKVGKIIVSCGEKWEKIKEKYGNKLVYAVEKEPLGTAGALKNSLKFVESEDVIVVNADDIADVDLNKLIKLGSNAICLTKPRSPSGVVEVENGEVKRFIEKPVLDIYVSIGHYLLNKGIKLPDKGSLEYDVFPKLKLKAYIHKGMWVTVNTFKDIEEAEKLLK